MLDNRGFDLWADRYDVSVGLSDESGAYPFAGYKEALNLIYNKIMSHRGARVLDIGLGTGVLAARLYAGGHEITGLDFSPEMLRLAGAKMPGARLLEHDFAGGLPPALDGETFDFIVSTYALHHLGDAAKAAFLAALLPRLRPGGAILLGDIGFQTRADLEACRAACGRAWDGEEFYPVYAELAAALRGIGRTECRQVSHCALVMEIRGWRTADGGERETVGRKDAEPS
jgi:putative AdoMet-dependent methyltransferase